MPSNTRPPKDETDLRYWLENMVTHHRFQMDEVSAATGLSFKDIASALRRLEIPASPEVSSLNGLRVMPYPGGRHPRIGFLDGAIDPQRETKISVFTPWDPSSYVVVDVPEAIWSNLGLTYLAHTHIDTVWSKDNIALPPQEWQCRAGGTLRLARTLPNGLQFGSLIYPAKDHVAMAMWLHNGTDQALSDLRVQNCVMLKAAAGFNALSNDNKTLADPYVACRCDQGDRWIITAWEPCHRAWANAPVPCLHADPRFPDTAPGETTILNGWLSFHEGPEVQPAIDAISNRWKRRTLQDLQSEINL
ncbi:MAG: hypothetical protein ABF370_00330 [Verrucomicrobiales bacterium]|nr:hypothetical protein [Verrucomicrobiaceae bacterium]